MGTRVLMMDATTAESKKQGGFVQEARQLLQMCAQKYEAMARDTTQIQLTAMTVIPLRVTDVTTVVR